MHNLAGATIKGYELREQLGVGGYGAVYRAAQPLVGREVAIKVILPQYANQPEFIRRFEIEAQLVARLEHPHIVPLYDYWREPDGAFLVMRWLRGGSLHKRLAGQPWSLAEVGRLLDQIAAALTVAHRHGVIHRDLKPANILLDEDDNAYLADFGIAKDLASGHSTDVSGVVGSPAYLAPEQIKAEPITPQTDIYSLGVMLYEILTGELPFEGPTPVAMLFQHVHAQAPHLQARRPDLSPALDAVIQRALAKNPAERYPDVMRLVADFRLAVGVSRERSVGSEAAAPAPDISTGRQPDLRRTGSIYDTGVLFQSPLLDAVVPAVENPYKGLRAFQEADAGDFFGRDALVDRLLDRLDERDAPRLLAVVGPSGSGKSSVVRAGVIPALRHGALPGSRHWFFLEMLPGAHPMTELANALLRVAIQTPEDLPQQLARDERGLLHTIQWLLPGGAETELVLTIDQFEEVFTLVQDEAERAHFLNSLLVAATDPHSRMRVIVTLRADFYDRPLLYPGLSEVVSRRTEVVTPLTPEEVRRAIVEPARRTGVTPEPDLVAAIMADVGEQPGALPLMQYALTELFERRAGRMMTLAAYRESGGVSGALARRAEAIYSELPATQQEAARQLFLRLVTPGEGAEDTRRRVPRSELVALGDGRRPTNDQRPTTNDQHVAIDAGSDDERSSVVVGRSSEAGRSSVVGRRSSDDGSSFVVRRSSDLDAVLDSFGRHRLLTFDRDPATREPTVEVAHEALIRTWPRLRAWLDESRDDLRLQRRLSAATAEWLAAGRDQSYLAGGLRLEQFADWAGQTRLALTTDERAFLDASLAERDARRAQEAARAANEAALERRARGRLRALVGVFVAATVVALSLAGIAAGQRQEAQRNAEAAQRNAEAAQRNAEAAARARQEAQRNAEEARRQEALALDSARQASASAEEARNVALFAGARAALSQGNTDQALMLATIAAGVEQPAPQAELVLSEAAYAPGTRMRLPVQGGRVETVAFSPDGATFLSGSVDGVMRLWDAASGQLLRPFEGMDGPVQAVAFSPDGRRALAGTKPGSLFLWNMTDGALVRTQTAAHADDVTGVAFSPVDGTAVSAGEDSVLILWDVDSGQEIRRFAEGHTQEVRAVAFTPDGRAILSSGNDSRIILWDVASGQEIRRFAEEHTLPVNSVAVSPKGDLALSAGEDTLVILWDIESGTPLHIFRDISRAAKVARFSPDGATTLAGLGDGRLCLWNVASRGLVRCLSGHGAATQAAAFSPDGRALLSGSNDGSLRLWDLRHGAQLGVIRGHTDRITSAVFSPDGRTILSGSADFSARVWDPASGRELAVLAGHNETVRAVAISPDGDRAITGGTDRVLIVHAYPSGEILHTLQGHTKGINTLAISPDGHRALSGAVDGTVILWDLDNGAQLATLGHGAEVRALAFSPDGATALTAGTDQRILLWDLATGTAIAPFAGHSARVRALAFSPDGKRFLSGGDDNLMILWDVAARKQLHVFSGHSSAVQAVAISPDGRYLLSGSDDRSIVLWDAATYQPLRRYEGHAAGVVSVAFRPDSRAFVSAGGDRTLRIWRIDTRAELLAWAKDNRYIPDLTCDQQELYRLAMPCVRPGAQAEDP